MWMVPSLGTRLGLDRAAAGYALRMAFAAWLAFAIAASLHVHNAYWAAMPVWVVAQSTRGLLLERGVFRIVGTLVGAGAGFLILHLPLAAPALCLLLAAWIAICSGLTHILRGVQSYGALMAGMTAAIVAIPSMVAADVSLATAVARVECTLIGVVVVTLVTGLFTPGSPRQAFYRRVRVLCGDAVAFAAGVLAGKDAGEGGAPGHRVLKEISEVEAAARLVSAGSLDGYRRLHHVDALVTSSLAVMAAAQALRGRGAGEAAGDIAHRLDDLARRLRAEDEAPPGAPVDLGDLPAQGGAGRRLAVALEDLMAAEAALRATPDAADARSFGGKLAYLAPDHDWPLALRAGGVSGLSALVAVSLGYWSGHVGLSYAAIGVCIYAMLLASMPLPQQTAPKLVVGATIGVVVATAYRFAVVPHVGAGPGLILSMAPFLLVGGFVRASSRTGLQGIEANMSFLMGSQAGMPAAQPDVILGTSAALLGAAALVCSLFVLLPRRPGRQAQRVARSIERDLERLVNRRSETLAAGWQPRTARQILRLMLHLGRAGTLAEHEPAAVLGALNLGYAILDLQHLAGSANADEATRGQARAALARLQGFAADPQGVADALIGQADAVAAPALATVLRDAAASLRDTAVLLASTA